MNNININGKKFVIPDGGDISFHNDILCVNGNIITTNYDKKVEIIIEGNCGDIDTTGNVTINGNCNDIDCNGNVTCYGDINGDIDCNGRVSLKRK